MANEPEVTVEVAKQTEGIMAPVRTVGPWRTYDKIKNYAISQDLMNLGDVFSCTIPNIGGVHNKYKFTRGDSIKFLISDPDVNSGKPVKKITGIVVKVKYSSSMRGGSSVTITGADLGWHLQHNDGPLWYNLHGATFKQLLNSVVDKSWGFGYPARGDNEANRNANLGSASSSNALVNLNKGLNYGHDGAVLTQMKKDYEARKAISGKSSDPPNTGQPPDKDASGKPLAQGIKGAVQTTSPDNFPQILPRIQIEPGEKIADVLITYARRVGAIVNVSYDGILQIFRPKYDQDIAGVFNYYDPVYGGDSSVNNVLDASYEEDLEHVFTDTFCIGTNPIAYVLKTNNPNEGHWRGVYKDKTLLPFLHRLTYSDADQLDPAMSKQRAKWKFQRSLFDAFEYSCTVVGHSQNGVFYTPDTMYQVHDDVNGINEKLYLRAVMMTHDDNGARSILKLHRPNLLTG